jgi:hypothetical protein
MTQVLELLSVVLNESRESEERWRRWSRQVVDTLLPLLAQGRVRLESREAQHSLQCVLASVAPCVLRPVDSLLRTLFSEAPQLVSYFILCSYLLTFYALLKYVDLKEIPDPKPPYILTVSFPMFHFNIPVICT